MKKLLFLLSLCHCFLEVISQKKNNSNPSFYAYDAKWNPTSVQFAKYLGVYTKLSDTAHEWRYYKFDGPLVSIETYKDEQLKIPHGYFAWFDLEGLIDSAGEVVNRKKHGSWLYFDDTLGVWQSEKYDNGILLKRKDLGELTRESKENDSIGLLPGDKEAVFKGGNKAWMKHLVNNIRFPERALKAGKTGKVMLLFTINTDGSLSDMRIQKSVEYSLDEEALRLLKISPKWEPATQLDRPVKAYRRQPVTFSM